MNGSETKKPLDDLEVMKILYEEHHKHLFPFIRLLIVLSVAFITLLASPGNKAPSFFLKASVFSHLISLLCGVVVLYQAVQAPLRQLRRYAERRKSEGLVLLDRDPSTLFSIGYPVQLLSFGLAFVLVLAHFIVL